MSKWIDAIKHNKLASGTYPASIKVKSSPGTLLGLRPIITAKGQIKEWHLLISDPPAPDYMAMSDGSKPEPGSPIRTPSVIRFHPDDVEAFIDVQKELRDFREKYETLRFQRD
jgi:hypothetical protein